MRILLIGLAALVLGACATQKIVDLNEGEGASAFIESSPTVLFKYIDDDPVPAGFVGQTRTYEVAPGQRVVMVEYSDLFEITNDEHDKVVSRPAKVTFTLEAGKTYQIGNPPQKKLEQAHAFAAKPDFWVVEKSTGEKITATVELSRPRTFLTQLRSAVTPVYEFESDRVAGSGAGEKTATTLDLMQNLWNQASEEERDSFLKWATQQ